MALEREQATFQRERPRLLSEGYAGRFALVKGDEVHSVWETRSDASQAGYLLFGLEPFFVGSIVLNEKPGFIPALYFSGSRCRTSHNPSDPTEP